MMKNPKTIKGFTLIELMIAIGIFVFMTALLLAKYGSFNQGILLTNLAYDVALTIRNAQSYGINVKSAPVSGGSNYSTEFNRPYGVYLNDAGGSTSYATNKEILFFIDMTTPPNYAYDPGTDVVISKYNIKRGSYISDVSVNYSYVSNGLHHHDVSITFVRPSPNAIIKSPIYSGDGLQYAEITLSTSNGETKKVSVNALGQIAIKD